MRALEDREDRMYWQGEVVAFLRDCKDAGWSFEEAWAMAMREHPPRGTGMGQRQLSFEDSEPSLAQFLEQACSDAWHGRHPALARLSTDLMDPAEGHHKELVHGRMAAV